MPLDTFQASILKVLSKSRTPESPVAGGAAMHMHGWRLSDDIDVFNKTGLDVKAVSSTDLEALEAAGFSTDVTKRYEGFVEAIITAEGAGMTNVQWVQYSGMNFFQPVEDAEFGCRLSFIDLAVNFADDGRALEDTGPDALAGHKVMAAASRRQPRDLLDLRFVGRTTLPLWNALNAVYGKDETMLPLQAIAMIRRYAQYPKGEIEESVILPEGFDVPKFVLKIRKDLDLAERQLDAVPIDLYGKVILNQKGQPLSDPSVLKSGHGWIARDARKGPPWPSGPDIDSLLVDRMIRHFGMHGEKLWERAPSDRAGGSAQSSDARSRHRGSLATHHHAKKLFARLRKL